jgi:hypothetical protein
MKSGIGIILQPKPCRFQHRNQDELALAVAWVGYGWNSKD